MRYVEAQEITDRQIRFRRHGQISMLVVELIHDNRHRALAEQFIEQLPRAAQEQERLRP